jgi:hypothetical protein
VSVRFSFEEPVGGRGANWENKGFINGAHLSLSAEEARRLAVALLCRLEYQTEKPLVLAFGRWEPGAAEKRKIDAMRRAYLAKSPPKK